jgi:polynucleotide 5'-kinase involved in rRNA processing
MQEGGPVKALSLRQPWAWLVVNAGKRIENRYWSTKFRGEFLIHAAKGCTRYEHFFAIGMLREIEFRRKLPHILTPAWKDTERGGIVGRARLVDVLSPCVTPVYGSCDEDWHMHDQYGFRLVDVVPMPFRPLRGELGFFEVAP